MLEERLKLRVKFEIATEGMGPFTLQTEAASSLTLVFLDEIMANMEGTIKGDEPESLHDMRVASRRLRSALQVFASCYPTVITEAERKVRSITSLLGFVRDLDVRMIHMSNIKPLMSSGARRATDLLIFNTGMQRDIAEKKMIEGLNQIKDGDWYDWMVCALSSPVPPRAGQWSPSIHSLKVIEENRSTVTSRAPLAMMEDALGAQHSLRISVKRYRYSIEVLAFCFTHDPRKAVSKCKMIQDDLGLMHDYDILREFISTTRSRTLPRTIKKGLDELRKTILNLRHQQFELFMEHLPPFIKMDPLVHR